MQHYESNLGRIQCNDHMPIIIIFISTAIKYTNNAKKHLKTYAIVLNHEKNVLKLWDKTWYHKTLGFIVPG